MDRTESLPPIRARAAAVPARPLPAALVAFLALLLASVAVATPAHAASGSDLEARFVAAVNAERAAAGLPALRVADELVSVGRQHAQRMASTADLHHNPNLGNDVTGWDKVGENVGRGPDVGRIHAAFMASPSHRANVLDPAWTEVGMGVVVVDGQVWVTELFRLPMAAATPAPAPASEPAPAPEPAAEAAPTPEPAPLPPPEPEPPRREVDDVRPHVDRISLVLARLDAAETP